MPNKAGKAHFVLIKYAITAVNLYKFELFILLEHVLVKNGNRV